MTNPQPNPPTPPDLQFPAGTVSREVAAGAVSAKVTWAAAASALATITWTIIATLTPDTFSPTTIATLTGSSATVLAFAGGYLVRDTLRGQP
jgi:hypothetical protein